MEKNTAFKKTYGPWGLVTGGNSGIGKEIAYQLASRGLDLILVARDFRRLRKQEDFLKKEFGIKVVSVQADLSNKEGIREVIDASRPYEVGFLVLSAGLENNGSFIKNDVEKEIQLVELNIISTIKLTHHFSQNMALRSRGGILLVSSLTGHMPSPYFANYGATKSYVLQFGISLHAELLANGVDVSVLSPGLTKTPMAENMGKDIDWSQTPMKFMEASEVAEEAINQFGKKISIIPGSANKILAFIMKRITSPTYGKRMAAMMQKAINPAKL